MEKILNWFFNGKSEMTAYYADRDYSPEALRLYSSAAPGKACQVDIRDDGVSILSDFATLEGDQTVEDLAGSFPNSKPTIEQGSVISCHIISTGGMATLNVQLEMETIDDGDEL